jgi:hypothetical protein
VIRWAKARVTGVVRSDDGLQEVTLQMESGETARGIHYTDSLAPLAEGDEVIVNSTAVELGLGTGGVHFVYRLVDGAGVLDQGKDYSGVENVPRGHLMKLRYTPLQRAALSAEEEASPFHRLFLGRPTLEGMPVLIGDVHSMLPAAVAWLRHAEKKAQTVVPLRLAYIMSDGGALPIAFSRHAAELKRRGWLQGTVTYGHAYGGDLETVNKFTALLAARHALHADIAIAAMGPGIAGTGTPLGHSGLEVGELVNAVASLGGVPIVMPRVSFAEPRERHRGVSHHTLGALATAAFAQARLPLPAELAPEARALIERQLRRYSIAAKHDVLWQAEPSLAEVAACIKAVPFPITTMGRSFREDPCFFLAVCAAAQAAWNVFSQNSD